MIIQLHRNCSRDERQELFDLLSLLNIKYIDINTQFQDYLVCILTKEIDIRKIGNLPCVRDLHRVTDSYKLVSRQWKVHPTRIDLGDRVSIGEGDLAIMAGPCSIEDEAQVDSVIAELKRNNVKIMRGGVYKPRSSPYSFRGLGIEGLKMWYSKCREHGIKIITEVMQVSQIDEMIDYIDIFQVGARNTQNFNLLDALGAVDKPVMIKRGISGSLEELLQSAEYIFSAGNEKLLLCERGIRTYEKEYRNTFDINAIPILKDKSHLPVIADPSHGIGLRRYVDKIALASVAAGADGVIIEIHPEPEKAASDGQQTLNYDEFSTLVRKLSSLQMLV